MWLEQLAVLPAWVYPVSWSVLVVLLMYLIGHAVTGRLCRRLTRWAERTSWKWDDALVCALRRGLPIWSVLFGLYVATGFWTWSERWLSLVMRSLYVATWLSMTWIAAGLAASLVQAYSGRWRQGLPVTSLSGNIARILVGVLGVLTILHGLGIPIAPLLTALGVGGLAVALALQDTLSNLFSGFYLTVARHVRVGDYIKLESGPEGYVDDISWRATTIRMLPNNMVVVPNKKLAEAIITNYHLPSRELAVLVELGVDYGSDLERVERITVDVARETMQHVAGGVPGFEPVVRFHTLGEYSIQGTAVLRAQEFVDQYLIKHEFIKRLHRRYAQERITIPFPTRTVRTMPSGTEQA